MPLPTVVHADAPISLLRYEADGLAPRPATMIHDYTALAFYTRGHASMEQSGDRLELREGDVLLVPAGAPHRRLSAREALAWGIGFHAGAGARHELAPLLDPFERARSGASPIVRIPGDRHEHLARLFDELRDELGRQEPGAHSELVQKGLLTLILAEVRRASSLAPAQAAEPTLVGEALRFIERHCLEPISLRDVADALARSPAYLTTALRRATGKTAVEWIVAGRMAEARRRLLHSDARIDAIAEQVGYADATHFIRLFRRTHGATPAAWRAMQRRAGLSG